MAQHRSYLRPERSRDMMRSIPQRGLAASRQRGVILVIALIVLVAMSLAAVALTRSVDTANIAAGNLSFRKSALSAADRGVETAISKFRGCGNVAVCPFSLEANTLGNNATHAYFATLQPSNVKPGIPNALLDIAAFDAAHATNKAAAGPGETVRYLIERQCDVSRLNDTWDSNHCAIAERAGARGGTAGAPGTGAGSMPLYRVTVRVDGPRNTTSYSQVVFRPS